MILWPVGQWRRFIQTHSPVPTHEIKGITRKHIGGFFGPRHGCHGEDEGVWKRKRISDERL